MSIRGHLNTQTRARYCVFLNMIEWHVHMTDPRVKMIYAGTMWVLDHQQSPFWLRVISNEVILHIIRIALCARPLTHWGPVISVWWNMRLWIGEIICSGNGFSSVRPPSHYLNKRWLFVNCNFGNKLHTEKFDENAKMSSQENAFESSQNCPPFCLDLRVQQPRVDRGRRAGSHRSLFWRRAGVIIYRL